MTNLRFLAFAGLGLALAACTITTGPGDDDDRRPWGTGDAGAGGQGGGGSETDAGTEPEAGSGGGDAGDGGSGGEGGQGPGDTDQCVQSPTAGDCEQCAFVECEAVVCDCKADADCAQALAASDFFACLEAADGDPTETANCDIEFISATETEDGGVLANDLGSCLHYGAGDSPGCPLECGT